MSRTQRSFFLTIAAAVVATIGLQRPATAGPFSNMVVFGDSLSDVGNLQQQWGWLIDTPGPYYWNGRFSNGPVWAETVMTGLGLPPLTPSFDNGTDYAYGGAQTTGTTGLNGIAIKDIDEQVSNYLGSLTPNASTLYVVFAGANDILQGQTNMSVPVNSLSSSINSLISHGAQQFLVINLPPIGDTPRFNTSVSNMNTYNSRSQQYNTALAAMIASTHTSHPSTTFYQYDLTGLFNQALANPAQFGLVNATASSAPGLSPGDTSYDTSREVSNPNQYLFWDDVHPTQTVHAILGRRILDLFFPPADYNRDVATDDADYVLYRKGLGTTYQPIDYNVWRAHFGQTTPGAGGSSFALASVPEPAAEVLLLFGFVFGGANPRICKCRRLACASRFVAPC